MDDCHEVVDPVRACRVRDDYVVDERVGPDEGEDGRFGSYRLIVVHIREHVQVGQEK